jgi:hypothetical protein
MFPELAEDFDPEEFPQHQDIEMKATDSSYKRLTAMKLLPYGTILRQVICGESYEEYKNDRAELSAEEQKGVMKPRFYPKPISA